jgi:murein DD-endopeptidase MepM/ murein hydrolase activator NlpD
MLGDLQKESGLEQNEIPGHKEAMKYSIDVGRAIQRQSTPAPETQEQPEEEAVTKVAKLAFVSPVKTKETIDGAQVITSAKFGPRPHPSTGKIVDHNGIDFRAKLGEPVFSVADGVVIRADRTDDDGSGLNVSIRHADGSVTKYYHASAITEGLEIGTEVKAGQEIMKAGSTGNSEAAHLHLELHKPNDNGELVPVNPLEHMGDLFSDFVIKKTGKTVAETYNIKVAGQGALDK